MVARIIFNGRNQAIFNTNLGINFIYATDYKKFILIHLFFALK